MLIPQAKPAAPADFDFAMKATTETRLAYVRDRLGFAETIVAGPGALAEMQRSTGGDLYDVVFDATGVARAMEGSFAYVASGGTLPRFYAQLLALRFEDQTVAGRTRLGFLMLPDAAPGHLPNYGLFGVGEDPAAVGYREADVVWHNRLFRLIRRPNP